MLSRDIQLQPDSSSANAPGGRGQRRTTRQAFAVMLIAVCGCEPVSEAQLDSAILWATPRPTTDRVVTRVTPPTPAASSPTPQTMRCESTISNLLKIGNKIYSGAAPDDAEAFAELRRLSIKTIVSVDGGRPKLEMARRYGLRYVHIPIGYDGISASEANSLAAVARHAKMPVFVHCHHGRHRGPAAAAIVAKADGSCDTEQALRLLELAGTNKDYSGLWRDVATFSPPASDQPLPDLVEQAAVEQITEAMVQIDHWFDQLAEHIDHGRPHPDDLAANRTMPSEAANIALQIQERLFELARHSNRDEQFVTLLNDGHTIASNLQRLIKENAPAEEIAGEMQQLKANCTSCHRSYRN